MVWSPLPKAVGGKKKGKNGSTYKAVTEEDKIVSYDNIEKQLEGIGVVTALVLGFAVGQLFCADKAEIIEADQALGTKWTTYAVLPSELMVDVGMTCALLELFAVVLDLVLYQFLLNYCRDRENEDQIRIWNGKFGWMLYLLYFMAFLGLIMYFWLLCICFTLRYPTYGLDAEFNPVTNTTTMVCKDSSCHKYYSRAFDIMISCVVVGGFTLGVYLFYAANKVSGEINDLRINQMEIPESLKRVVDEVMCSVEGAPLELLWDKTSRLASMMNSTNQMIAGAQQLGAEAVLKVTDTKKKVASKAGMLKGKLFGKKNKVAADESHTNVEVIAVSESKRSATEVDLEDVDISDEDRIEMEGLEADGGISDTDYNPKQAHQDWLSRHNTMVKCLRDFSYFTEAELVADRSDQYLLQELIDAGIENARDRACLVDIFKDGGNRTKKLNKLIYGMVQLLKKDFKKRHKVDHAAKLEDEELDQYRAMSFTPPVPNEGDEYQITGIVPPSLTRHSKLMVVVGGSGGAAARDVEVNESRT